MSLFGFDTHRGSWSSPANRNWLEARQEIQSSLHWGSRRITETSNRLPCLVPKAGGWACFLRGVTIGACPGVWLEGWLRCLAHSLHGVDCMYRTQLLLLTLWLCFRHFKSSSWVFWCLCIFCPEFTLPKAGTQLFLVPYSFFVFYFLRRGVFRCKHHSTIQAWVNICPISWER